MRILVPSIPKRKECAEEHTPSNEKRPDEPDQSGCAKTAHHNVSMSLSRKLGGFVIRRKSMSRALGSGSFHTFFTTALLLAASASAQVVPGRYILILQDPPVSSRFSSRAELESSAATAYRLQIEAHQAS